MAISFLIFLLGFTLVGVASAWQARGTKKDYYLASSSVKPWLVGLSAVATNNSGYMFIGVIGYTYATGLPAIWLMIGWITGDYFTSIYIHKRLRQACERSGEVSYAGVISNWNNNRFAQLKRVIGIISILFLTAYASAQLLAGSKALHVLFDWPLWLGAVLGAILVAIYCFAGGIRASIWTDAAQSFVMIVAMFLLLVICVQDLGGMSQTFNKLDAIDDFMLWFPQDLWIPGVFGLVVFVTSWFFAGLSVIGQPHIMVRFMALNESKAIHSARAYYYIWFTAFYCMATAVGLISRLYFPDAGNFDPELALPNIAKELLPPILAGLILAGVFAATMSTADSLLLSCSATLTNDFLDKDISKTWQLKVATIFITLFALLLALYSKQSVFDMVIMSWSGLASAFAPLLIFLSLGKRTSQAISIFAVIAGFSCALVWRQMDLHQYIYEGLPGILMGLMILFAASYSQKLMAQK